jgi:hypothetical protein
MRRLLLSGVLLWFTCLSAGAASIAIDQGLFGHLNQADVDVCTSQTGINNSCGPTAFVNSMVYLENRYPTIYDHNLIPHLDNNTAYQDQIAAAETAACYMGCDGNAGGTTISNFINGKQLYFDASAPNTTYFEVMNFFANGAWPTFNFLYNMLLAGEDVELLVGFYSVNAQNQLVRQGGHYLTLTGVAFGVPFATGNGTMNFVDPNGGANMNNLALSTFAFGAIYNNQGGYSPNYTLIEAAVAESPLPEPGTLLLIATGTVYFLLRRRVR